MANTSNLLLHCGAEAITRDALRGVLPSGPLGRFHNPTPYADFVDLVDENLAGIGYRINDEAFGVTNDGGRFFGLLEAAPLEGEYLPRDQGYALSIGVRGSYDQSFPRGLAVGSRVFVCDNLCFSGEVVVKTRQTTNIGRRLPALVYSAMQQVAELAQVQANRAKVYRNFPMRPRWGDAALVELHRREVLNSQTLPRAIAEWDNPTHPEHCEEGIERTAWTLQNAVTEAIKPLNGRPGVVNNVLRTVPLTRFLDELTGL